MYLISFNIKICLLILFICGLFNNAVSSSDYIASDDRIINLILGTILAFA
jgi:hypothetical protein